MNNIWSEQVQGIMTLYLSRKLRFNDCFAEQYLKAFNLDKNAKMRILEIGCGPGALVEAMRQNDLEAISQNRIPGYEKIKEIINRKYDKRLELYRAGVKQWDTSVSLTMIIRGEV